MKLLLTIILLMVAVCAEAQETKLDVKNDNRSHDESELTNLRLRTESGSTSKYSISISGVYLGGSIEKPLSANRPNLANNPVAPEVLLSSILSGRYRLSHKSSLTFGTGLNIVRPFHGNSRSEVYDPVIGHSWSGQAGGLQLLNFATLTYYTSQNMLDVLNTYNATNTLSIYKRIGSVGYSLSTSVWGNVFRSTTKEGINLTGSQVDYGFAFVPSLDFYYSDTLSLRTEFNQMLFVHTRNKESWNDFLRFSGSQSLGLGWSVSRNLYLYPNVQFSTEKLSAEYFEKRFTSESTVGVSATVNVF